MEKNIIDEKNGLDYKLVGDYYIPCLKAPEAPKVGRFGMMYHDYLRNHKRLTYSGLMLSGKLKEQIEEVDRQAEEMFSQLVEQMKQAEDVTEQLKASNQMEWGAGVRRTPLPKGRSADRAGRRDRRMNSIRGRAEEVVKSEVVFA